MVVRVSDIFKNKQEARRRDARLPFQKKLRILVELQKRAKPILESAGRKATVWTCFK